MNVKTITMPQLGESVTEGTISQWLVTKGEQVEKYQPLVEVMTDKVNAEVPASFSGKIVELLINEGETVKVGTEICKVELENETIDDIKTEPGHQTELAAAEDQLAENHSMRQRYSPAVLALASQHQIDLAQIQGTGRGGRITRKDIQKLIEQGMEENGAETVKPKPTIQSSQLLESLPGDREIPVTGIRKAIATNMVRATSEIPHAWMMIEVDVTNLVKYRNDEKNRFRETEGYNLSYFAFFLNAVAKALKKFPELNSSWAGNKIIQHKDINLSIAIGSEKELYVPVIRNVDEKSIKGIAKDIHVLAQKARNGTLTHQDMEGGTFTVNNTGTFGSVQSMGVINYPQAAILQVESIVKRPVIINDMFAARDMVNLCLSLDHRILDGVICGRFMSHVKEILENISGETTPIY
ncbi:dihydrolipoamide acetyltransferase family protein [Amphibacillus sediminis]|uniref:dihydrolipoamide acetyltransferase family protein n=1 Tax=Amphibacillus sediminis TaxID=360185 RepID=UPI000830B0D8|nr:dihydrolipoamide acetyltransferase family protein [Amphibacillus sediminis]